MHELPFHRHRLPLPQNLKQDTTEKTILYARSLTARICGRKGEDSRRLLKKTSSKAAADESTGGVASGYVEDAFEGRTKLADFFSNLLLGSFAALERP